MRQLTLLVPGNGQGARHKHDLTLRDDEVTAGDVLTKANLNGYEVRTIKGDTLAHHDAIPAECEKVFAIPTMTVGCPWNDPH